MVRIDMYRDYRMWTPLHYAAQNGDVSIASLLVQRGADINAEDEEGVTPFQLALEKDNYFVVGYFVARNADWGSVTRDGRGIFELATGKSKQLLEGFFRIKPNSFRTNGTQCLNV